MSYLKAIASAFLDPRLWLGIGLGIGTGVVIASGIEFDRSDSARFIGALIGALIAVSGAIALHYLKSNEEREERRNNLRHLIYMAKQFSNLARNDISNISSDDEKVFSAVEAFCSQVERTKRYAEKHEFEDIQISSSQYFLEDLDVAYIRSQRDNIDSNEGRKKIIEVLAQSEAMLDNARFGLDEKIPKVER